MFFSTTPILAEGSSMAAVPLAFIDTSFPRLFTCHCRKPSLKPLSFPAPPILEATAAPSSNNDSPPIPSAPDALPPSPICVDKTKGRRKVKNVFIDNHGFPDVSNDFNTLLHNINGGLVLCKLKHSPPDPNGPADPLFLFKYNKAQHGQWLCEQLNLSHLNQVLRDRINALVIKYWSVFDERGTFVPVCNYKCVIDTGNAAPITVKKIYYGPKEILIMHQAISALQKVGHV
jgi:hypothetical protein